MPEEKHTLFNYLPPERIFALFPLVDFFGLGEYAKRRSTKRVRELRLRNWYLDLFPEGDPDPIRVCTQDIKINLTKEQKEHIPYFKSAAWWDEHLPELCPQLNTRLADTRINVAFSLFLIREVEKALKKNQIADAEAKAWDYVVYNNNWRQQYSTEGTIIEEVIRTYMRNAYVFLRHGSEIHSIMALPQPGQGSYSTEYAFGRGLFLTDHGNQSISDMCLGDPNYTCSRRRQVEAFIVCDPY